MFSIALAKKSLIFIIVGGEGTEAEIGDGTNGGGEIIRGTNGQGPGGEGAIN